MSSSFYPWDCLNKISSFLSAEDRGVYGLNCNDPFIAKILLRKIKIKFEMIQGSALDHNWVEHNIMSLDLFSREQLYNVMQAEQIKNGDELFFDSIDWGDSLLFLMFSKEHKLFTKLQKKYPEQFIKILTPPFWHGNKLFSFLANGMQINFPSQVIDYLVEILPLDSGEYINAIKTLALHLPQDGNLSIKSVQALVEVKRLDHFFFADLWSRKEKVSFFKDLNSRNLSYDERRFIFSFMQSHLLKIADPSYIKEKNKPSKYDLKIADHSKKWDKADLRNDMRLFGEMEIMAKRQDPKVLDMMYFEELSRNILNN